MGAKNGKNCKPVGPLPEGLIGLVKQQMAQKVVKMVKVKPVGSLGGGIIGDITTHGR